MLADEACALADAPLSRLLSLPRLPALTLKSFGTPCVRFVRFPKFILGVGPPSLMVASTWTILSDELCMSPKRMREFL